MREAREEIEKNAPRKRKPLVREDSSPELIPPMHPEDTRKAALARAYAEMMMDDRFNTEET